VLLSNLGSLHCKIVSPREKDLAMKAVNKLRLTSIRNGKPEMSLAEINAEISEARRRI